MERIVETDGEKSAEAVRAAESLFGLDVTLRYQNEPDGSLRLLVDEASAGAREEYETLGFVGGPSAEEIEVVAQLTLRESARVAGLEHLADDVLSGLDRVFPGGVGHDVANDEAVWAEDVSQVLDPEQTRYSHVDAHFVLGDPQHAFVCERLAELDDALDRLVELGDGEVRLRGRFPPGSVPEQIDRLWELALDSAAYANGGHVRFRHHGVWSDVVEGLGTSAPKSPPEDWIAGRKRTVRGVLSRLLRRE